MSVSDDLRALVRTNVKLAKEVKDLRDAVILDRVILKRQRRLTRWMGLVVFGLAILAGNLVYWSFQVQSTQDDLRSTSCDLYGLFITSLQNPDPEQIDTPEKKAQFEESAKVIFDIYDSLKCA